MRGVKRGEKIEGLESETTFSSNLGKGRIGVMLEEESSVVRARRSGAIGEDVPGLWKETPGALIERSESNFEVESD